MELRHVKSYSFMEQVSLSNQNQETINAWLLIDRRNHVYLDAERGWMEVQPTGTVHFTAQRPLSGLKLNIAGTHSFYIGAQGCPPLTGVAWPGSACAAVRPKRARALAASRARPSPAQPTLLPMLALRTRLQGFRLRSGVEGDLAGQARKKEEDLLLVPPPFDAGMCWPHPPELPPLRRWEYFWEWDHLGSDGQACFLKAFRYGTRLTTVGTDAPCFREDSCLWLRAWCISSVEIFGKGRNGAPVPICKKNCAGWDITARWDTPGRRPSHTAWLHWFN
ncbi:unnamed protein product [Symbiodinium sp. CCMP2592]|nr:unnamed protein product [Symbiodinium sp. CCMP2592]